MPEPPDAEASQVGASTRPQTTTEANGGEAAFAQGILPPMLEEGVGSDRGNEMVVTGDQD